MFSVCCGLFIAVMAGVAYGYNYCMAEFITLTRSDVRVYMKRGQFQDKPDLLHAKRKSGDEDDIFPYNLSDYHQQVPLGDDSLSENWMKDQDTRNYAARLNKFSEEKTFVDSGQQVDLQEKSPVYYKFTTPPSRRASYVPHRIISTTILRSGSSEIVLRKFETMPDVLSADDIISDLSDSDTESSEYILRTTQDEMFVEEIENKVVTLHPDIRIRIEHSPKKGKTIQMRHWRTTAKPNIMDYSPDLDEEAVVYRAI